MKKFPYVPEGLVEALEQAFPDRVLRTQNPTLHEVGRLAGQQDVIDLLRQRASRQNQLTEG